ncbi:extracellular solute-binding protein [Streptomyces boluensis]|uniref:Extracellular solute-binding protein n=1 Tax=Streptomyces boluensis TaxID=1775135 RepID=A0A964UIX8_9ACTN|nr:extracellular solute-binding protein [Streptomyces boluensis]NBE49939.1 extracellular solute-binding protein [Streptomyces boluensis]
MGGDGRIVVDILLADHPVVEGFLDPVRRRAAEFGAAHPDYEIRISTYRYWSETGREDFIRTLEQGRVPALVDVFFTETQHARDAVAATGGPLFTPVQRAVGGRREILGEPVILDDFIDTARRYYSYDGELVSVPFSVSTGLLYANMTMLRAAGITEVPQDWEGLEAACRAVMRTDGGPSHAITWAVDGWFFQDAVCHQSGLLVDHANGRSDRAQKVDLASEELLAWATWWQRLHKDGLYLHTGAAQDWMGTFKAFTEGRVAFLYNSSVMAQPVVSAAAKAGIDVVACGLPHNGAVPYGGNVLGGDSLFLAAGLSPEVEDGALAFLQYLLNPDGAAAWHKSSGFIPVTHGSHQLLEAEGWFAEKPHHLEAPKQLGASDGSPAATGALVGELSSVHADLVQAMRDVLEQGADPARRFTQATVTAQRRLDDYNRRTAERHAARETSPPDRYGEAADVPEAS